MFGGGLRRAVGSNQYRERWSPNDPRLGVPSRPNVGIMGVSPTAPQHIEEMEEIAQILDQGQFVEDYARTYYPDSAIPPSHAAGVATYALSTRAVEDSHKSILHSIGRIDNEIWKKFRDGANLPMLDRFEANLFKERFGGLEKGEPLYKASHPSLDGLSDDEFMDQEKKEYERITKAKNPLNQLDGDGLMAARSRLALDRIYDLAEHGGARKVKFADNSDFEFNWDEEGPGQRERFIKAYDESMGNVQAQMFRSAIDDIGQTYEQLAQVYGIERYIPFRDRVQMGLVGNSGEVLGPGAAYQTWHEANLTSAEQAQKIGKAAWRGVKKTYRLSKAANEMAKNYSEAKDEERLERQEREKEIRLKRAQEASIMYHGSIAEGQGF